MIAAFILEFGSTERKPGGINKKRDKMLKSGRIRLRASHSPSTVAEEISREEEDAESTMTESSDESASSDEIPLTRRNSARGGLKSRRVALDTEREGKSDEESIESE